MNNTYKVGDWATIVSDAQNGYMRIVGNTYKIISVGGAASTTIRLANEEGIENDTGSMFVRHIRPATPREIALAKGEPTEVGLEFEIY